LGLFFAQNLTINGIGSIIHVLIEKRIGMRYTLILKNGTVMVFSVLACAELYKTINVGSTLITENLENVTESITV